MGLLSLLGKSFTSAIKRTTLSSYSITTIRTNHTVLKLSKMNVYVSRNVPVSGLERLQAAGLNVAQWKHNDVVPRDELLSNVKDSDGLFCLLTDQVDSELLNAAGEYL